MGFDDIELARHVGLTTMRQPMYAMGTLALEKLAARMREPSLPPTLSTFTPELIVRGTCGAAPFNGGGTQDGALRHTHPAVGA